MPKIEKTTGPARGSGGAPAPRTRGSSTTGTGWDKAANRKKQADEQRNSVFPSFRLKDGESAVVQIVEEEPYCLEGCNLKLQGHWKFVPSQLTAQKHDLMIQAGHKPVWKAVFTVLDHRGKWDKDAKDFAHDGKPVERIWLVSATLAQQIKALADKKGRAVNAIVIEVTRTGSGAKDTTYNLERALDDDDKPYVAKDMSKYTRTLEPVDKLLTPPTDEQLLAMGFASTGDKPADGDYGDDTDY